MLFLKQAMSTTYVLKEESEHTEKQTVAKKIFWNE